METKYFRGHLPAYVAHKAKKSQVYVVKLANGEREANTDIAKKIIKAAEIIEDALEAADKKIDKIFSK